MGIKHYGSGNSELCIIFSNLFLVNVTNLYIQKEHFTLLDKDGKPSMFALVMIVPLSTCAHLQRDNISFRLNSGRKQYILKGGKLGRPTGSTKSQDKKREEYKEVISLLNKEYAIRDVVKLSGKSISTVQRIMKEFATCSLNGKRQTEYEAMKYALIKQLRV